MYSIEIEQVTKTFNRFTAVNQLSLNVPKGSIYGFIGPNGSGKTTTIRMIMNIFYPDSGNIKILGKEHTGSTHENIGYLPEERGLYKKMKVGELLQFYGQLRKTNHINHKIDYWLKKLELGEWKDKKIEALSKGMSQKIQFISTIIHEPEIIILDEPFSGLDPVNADILKTAILELREKGATIIFSTHDMNMAERMCDYIFMIYKGTKVLDGTLADIQDKYGSDTISLQTANGAKALQGINGIEKINDFGQIQEIRIAENYDPQDILKAIINQSKVYKFEITRPSLNDIFIRIARPVNGELQQN
ncbi:MAG: ATP-binding cassette domain-containing protein [Bacteroidales bacterium]|nr:ATP-binding cassette domain-containing protein [Bacteroidales bacterium]